MTRQQQITLEQVRAKKNEARQRVDNAIRACMKATSNEEYSRNIEEACRASSDYDKWCITLETLEEKIGD